MPGAAQLPGERASVEPPGHRCVTGRARARRSLRHTRPSTRDKVESDPCDLLRRSAASAGSTVRKSADRPRRYAGCSVLDVPAGWPTHVACKSTVSSATVRVETMRLVNGYRRQGWLASVL